MDFDKKKSNMGNVLQTLNICYLYWLYLNTSTDLTKGQLLLFF